jgi:hypothetical protein
MSIPTNGPHKYLYGQSSLLSVEFRDLDGNLIDPDSGTVIIEVTPPGTATLVYGFPTGPDGDLANPSTGRYTVSQRTKGDVGTGSGAVTMPTPSGNPQGDKWYYRAEGESVAEAIQWAEEYSFIVLPSRITPPVG